MYYVKMEDGCYGQIIDIELDKAGRPVSATVMNPSGSGGHYVGPQTLACGLLLCSSEREARDAELVEDDAQLPQPTDWAAPEPIAVYTNLSW